MLGASVARYSYPDGPVWAARGENRVALNPYAPQDGQHTRPHVRVQPILSLMFWTQTNNGGDAAGTPIGSCGWVGAYCTHHAILASLPWSTVRARSGVVMMDLNHREHQEDQA